MAACFDAEDAESRFGDVKSDAVNQTGQGFPSLQLPAAADL